VGGDQNSVGDMHSATDQPWRATSSAAAARFADFRGNMQYITTGNVRHDDRVALFLMDQAQRRRLKIFARVELRPVTEDLRSRLVDSSYDAHVERAYLFHIEAFDWNCPQHITPRFSADELRGMGDETLATILADPGYASPAACP
jgi:predicted pyridoxine 5'-phosphate oxidase superfamily flavin-nucleotide-binding protein